LFLPQEHLAVLAPAGEEHQVAVRVVHLAHRWDWEPPGRDLVRSSMRWSYALLVEWS
jgi:hypothetical protein